MRFSFFAAIAFILFIGGFAALADDNSSRITKAFGSIGAFSGCAMLVYPFLFLV